MTVARPDALRQFVAAMTRQVEREHDESVLLACARDRLGDLVARDDWLPDELALPHPTYYQQYLLYADPLDRYSVVSFVWGPGQRTPIHDHTVWGAIGVLRGAELAQRYRVMQAGVVTDGDEARLDAGQIDVVSPALGDVHRVRNAFDDRVSISIHVYGGNIGRITRHAFDAATGTAKTFVSGYGNRLAPNLWFGAAG
jgi:predicted metal-dependent enzyme (double-stranded beta helix superfamily)